MEDYIEMTQMKHQLRQRRQMKLYEPTPFGSALRFGRLEKNMTLEEVAEGICSVSYLSKAENNMIIVSEKFAVPLAERVGIQISEEKDDEIYKSDRSTMIDHLIMNTGVAEEMLARYEHRKDHQAEIIRLCYHIINKNDQHVVEPYNKVKSYLLRLDDFEVNLFVYLTYQHLYDQEKYDEAHESIMEMTDVGLADRRLNLLAMEGRLLCSYRMHRISEIVALYPEYMKHVIDQQVYHRTKRIEKEHLLFESYYRDPKQMEERMGWMSQIDPNDKDLILAHAHVHHQHYDRAIEYVKAHDLNDEQWMTLYLIALDRIEDRARIESIILDHGERTDLSRASRLLIRHLKYKYTADRSQLMHYLKHEMLGVGELTDDYVLLNYLMVDSQRLFSAYTYYKNATRIMNNFLPKIRRMQKTY